MNLPVTKRVLSNERQLKRISQFAVNCLEKEQLKYFYTVSFIQIKIYAYDILVPLS